RRKPIVIYNAGRSSAGGSWGRSHTGALAGDYAVSEGVLRQAGAILAHKSDEILSLAEALSLVQPLRSRRLAVLADGGGHATIAADALTERGLALAHLSEATRSRLATILPSSAALTNPVDVAGGTDGNPAIFAECARILLEDAEVDGLLITGLYGGYGVRFSSSLTDIELETSDKISRLPTDLGKPILVHSLYGSLFADLPPAPLRRLRQMGVPVYDSLELAVRCLQAVAEFGEVCNRAEVDKLPEGPRQQTFEDVLAACRRDDRTVVLEHEARRVLAAAGIAM